VNVPTSNSRQLVLDLPHRAALEREDFLVAPSNAAAVAFIDRWPQWPGPGLALFGPPGSGKSHLAAVWRAKSGAVSVSAAALGEGRVEARACVFEEGEGMLADPRKAEALFHLYNRVAAARGHILVTGVAPPARWPIVLADLASRLRALPAVEIKPPDDAMLSGLFVKLFRDRQLAVPGDVVLYLVQRIERSCAAVARAVEALDRASLAERRPITLPLARAALGLA
jgi:chromosomal replication initiation ATPase DnaA